MVNDGEDNMDYTNDEVGKNQARSGKRDVAPLTNLVIHLTQLSSASCVSIPFTSLYLL